MPRPSRKREQREELLPVLAAAFTHLGYRRATTAALAERCGVQENILYRLWPDKRAMFLAAISYVYEFSEQTWLRMLERSRGQASAARRLLEFESQHLGEFGHYRIIFTALGETDDPEIRAGLQRLFARFHRFLLGQIVAHRLQAAHTDELPADLAAWAAIGLGMIVNIGRELGLLNDSQRKRLIGVAGQRLLEGQAA